MCPALDSGSVSLQVEYCQPPSGCPWMDEDDTKRCFRLIHHPEFGDAMFCVRRGPQEMPSKLLGDLEHNGVVVVENVVPKGSIQALRNAINSDRNSLGSTPVFGKTIVHPVLKWIRSQALGPEVRLAHQPVMSKRPANEKFEKWHTDWPYHGKRASFTGPLQGIQELLCGHSFRKDNGATQYVPNSHRKGHGPPGDWNHDPKAMVHKHKIKQMLAPAGAVCVFDARLWHRRCPETVHGEHDRHTIIASYVGRKHKRMHSVHGARAQFQKSKVSLTSREIKDVNDLLRDT